MNYDFIEIGSNCFRTLAERYSGPGIMVEPVEEYFNQIPHYPNVIKRRSAIVPEHMPIVEGRVPMFIFPSANVPPEHGCLKGSSSLIPDQHKEHTHRQVEVQVPAMRLHSLFTIYDVKYVKYLKIDAEGVDSDLVLELCSWFDTSRIDIIQFEINGKTEPQKVKQAEEALASHQFLIRVVNNHDILAINNKVKIL